MKDQKKNILILMGRYLPGHKDGGPVTTISNLINAFNDRCNFYVGCLDRDSGDKKPYDGVKVNKWNVVGNSKVFYAKKFTLNLLKKLCSNMDCVYICGCYDDYAYLTLLLKKRRVISMPIYIAAMGNFSTGAMSIKKAKKKLYISFCRKIGLFKDVTWSVTSKKEEQDTKNIIGNEAKCIIAEDIPNNSSGHFAIKQRENSIVFLSRICKMKNLLGTIKALSHLKENVKFDIYGPIEDDYYWKQCLDALSKLPANVSWRCLGEVPFREVKETLSKYYIFILPSLGENYGHVIFESLSVGCLPIVSDNTPWNIISDLGLGFVLHLTDEMINYTEAINIALSRSLEERESISSRAISFSKKKYEETIEKSGYLEIFGC